MSVFIETPRFPDEIAAWASGGRGFLTTIVETYSGNEFRNSPWALARGTWNWSTNNQEVLRSTNPTNAYSHVAVRNMYRVARGRLYAFRFKDFTDYQDEGGGVLGTTGVGVAATLAYQMYKNYAVSPLAYQQMVQKPVGSTIKVFINGVQKATPADYTLDATTGIVTFAVQPTIGTPLTWTGQFDIPVRFDFDMPDLGIEGSGAYFLWQNMRIIEVRNP